MTFADKLNFLMNITQASNKELAAFMYVDRSLISLLRNGKRNPPKNKESIYNIALFFAGRCNAEYQRHALSEMLSNSSVRSPMHAEELAKHIYKWLYGEMDLVEHILDEINATAPSETEPVLKKAEAPPVPIKNESLFFYGNAGRREALHHMLNIVNSAGKPSTILFTGDDYLEWLLEDHPFSAKIQSQLIKLLKQGCTLYQIIPSLNFLNQYVAALRFWLPIYVTGQVRVFYYPRLRDNLYQHSEILLPGCCVQSSINIGTAPNYITLVSTDPSLVKEHVNQFKEYASLCKPALAVHDTNEDFMDTFIEIMSKPGMIIQKTFPLSGITLSKEFLIRLSKETDNAFWKKGYQVLIDLIPIFEEHLRQDTFIDFSFLATAEEIRKGKIPIGCSYLSFPGHPVYTPDTYILHLERILELMDKYENYHFVIVPNSIRYDYNLVVNDCGMAHLIRGSKPPLLLEFRRPELVQTCKEHLLRMVEAVGYNGIQRSKTIMQIKALIQELKKGK